MMNKTLSVVVLLLSVLAFTSCGDDERVYIKWEIINEAKNDIKVTDEPMMYIQVTIVGNGNGGDVVLNSTNFGELSIEDVDNDGVFRDNGCKFSASVMDGHRVAIHLDPMELLEIPGINREKVMYVTAKQGKRTVICGINVKRKSGLF